MMERFTEQGWDALLVLPTIMMIRIGVADGELQPDEMRVFNEQMAGGPWLRDPLLRELAPKEVADLQRLAALVERSTDPQWEEYYVEMARYALQSALSTEEYQRFGWNLAMLGMAVSRAHISGQETEEFARLYDLAQYFGWDISKNSVGEAAFAKLPAPGAPPPPPPGF